MIALFKGGRLGNTWLMFWRVQSWNPVQMKTVNGVTKNRRFEMITYRKTKAGKWVVCGPPSEIRAMTYVTVTKKSGESEQRWVEKVGKPFQTPKGELVYGYLGRKDNFKPVPHLDYPGKMCPRCESEPLNNNLACWECGYRG
jgi:hypothetical protein